MGYIESTLTPGEEVIYRVRGTVNWVVFAIGLVLCLALVGLLILPLAFVPVWTTEMAVTNRRVIGKTGLFSARTIELYLTKIESIRVEQGLLGRLIGSGTVIVVGTGGTRETFRGIPRPLDFRHAVQTQSPAA